VSGGLYTASVKLRPVEADSSGRVLGHAPSGRGGYDVCRATGKRFAQSYGSTTMAAKKKGTVAKAASTVKKTVKAAGKKVAKAVGMGGAKKKTAAKKKSTAKKSSAKK